MSRVLVAGVGNPDRGDDAAGWLVAEALRPRLADLHDVEVVATSADPSALLTLPAWDRAEHLVVIDAVRSGASAGSVHLLQGAAAVPPAAAGGTHDLGLATTLALARALGRLPAVVTVVGIEGVDFRHGVPPSPGVRDGIDAAVATVEVRVRTWVQVSGSG